MRIILATGNADKIAEIRRYLSDLPIEILDKNDIPNFPEIAETADTLEGNARLKAEGIFATTGIPALADDTGLEVDALAGAPGVYSARYAGDNATYQDNCDKLLAEMRSVPSGQRGARFRTVIAIAWGGKVDIADGELAGEITLAPRGEKGFGYDPVFYHPGLDKTLAEMTMDEKNSISHRGLALAKAREILRGRLGRP